MGAHLESDTLGPLRELLHVGVADRGLLRRHVLRDGCPWENSFRETQAGSLPNVRPDQLLLEVTSYSSK